MILVSWCFEPIQPQRITWAHSTTENYIRADPTIWRWARGDLRSALRQLTWSVPQGRLMQPTPKLPPPPSSGRHGYSTCTSAVPEEEGWGREEQQQRQKLSSSYLPPRHWFLSSPIYCHSLRLPYIVSLPLPGPNLAEEKDSIDFTTLGGRVL